MRLDVNLPEVRDWRDVLYQVDEPLREAGFVGREPPPRFSEVAPLLTPPQQVLWLTDGFVEATSQREPLSSWKGVFAPEDGLARQRLDALVAAGEAFAPEVAALVRWTLGLSPEAPVARVVPALWHCQGAALRSFFQALVQRWPEALPLEQLPATGASRREAAPASSGPVRFPLARWAPNGGEGEESFSRGRVLSQALLALWRGGAGDAELVRFHEEFLREWGREPDTLARWLTVAGPDAARLDALRTRLHAPRPVRLEERAVRSYESVRERIDSLLGQGHCSVDEAARRLSPVERVTWALDELYAAMCRQTFHLWDQSWVEGDFDGPGLVSRIAVAARELEPLASDLFQWTARWAREGSIPLVSLVPDVWLDGLDAGEAFIRAVAERWPEDLEPQSLPEPPRWSRPLLAPSTGPVRYPDVCIGVTPQGAGCPVQLPAQASSQGIAARVLFTLWRAGVSDAELADFSREYGEAPKREPEVLSRWVLFDGDGGDDARREALRERLHPQHPIAKWMGVAEFDWPLFLLVEEEDLDVLQPHLSQPELERHQPTPDVPLTQWLRAMLRMDPDWLMVSASGLDPDGARMILQASLTGHSVIVGGDGPGVEHLRAAFLEAQIPWEQLLDYRRGRGRRPASA
jgi:hypothetical protein